MADDKRFKIWDNTSVGARFFNIRTTVRIEDKETGNKVDADGENFEEAKAKAWKALEEKQGPAPSQL